MFLPKTSHQGISQLATFDCRRVYERGEWTFIATQLPWYDSAGDRFLIRPRFVSLPRQSSGPEIAATLSSFHRWRNWSPYGSGVSDRAIPSISHMFGSPYGLWWQNVADRKGMKRVFGYLGSFGSAGDVHFSSEMPTFASFGEILKSAA